MREYDHKNYLNISNWNKYVYKYLLILLNTDVFIDFTNSIISQIFESIRAYCNREFFLNRISCSVKIVFVSKRSFRNSTKIDTVLLHRFLISLTMQNIIIRAYLFAKHCFI